MTGINWTGATGRGTSPGGKRGLGLHSRLEGGIPRKGVFLIKYHHIQQSNVHRYVHDYYLHTVHTYITVPEQYIGEEVYRSERGTLVGIFVSCLSQHVSEGTKRVYSYPVK